VTSPATYADAKLEDLDELNANPGSVSSR